MGRSTPEALETLRRPTSLQSPRSITRLGRGTAYDQGRRAGAAGKLAAVENTSRKVKRRTRAAGRSLADRLWDARVALPFAGRGVLGLAGMGLETDQGAALRSTIARHR